MGDALLAIDVVATGAAELEATTEDVAVGPAAELELDPLPLAPDLSTTADTI